MLKVTKKYIISFPKEKGEKIAELLADQGVAQVIDQETQKDVQDQLQDVDYKLASTDFVLSLLKPFTKKKSLIEKIKHPRILMQKTDFQGIAEQEPSLVAETEAIEDLEKKMEALKQAKHQAEAKLEELKKFGNLEFKPAPTSCCFCLVVEIPVNRKIELTDFCLKKGLHLRALFHSSSIETALIIGLKEALDGLSKFLETINGRAVQYGFEDAPFVERQRAIEAIRSKEKALQQCRKMLKGKAKLFQNFQAYYDFLSYKKARLRVKKGALRSSFLSYIVFWALPADKKHLQEIIQERFSESEDFQITEASIEKDEEQPVVLENKKAMNPFQYVTEIFGQPKASEIDPTPYLSMFFILFFAISITDAGYGILLCVFTGLALLFLGNLFKDTKLIRLLFYGGLSTFVVGILFGGFFGVSQATLSRIPVLGRAKMIDPLQDTVLFMGLTFALGYLQIVFAEVVKIIAAVRNQHKHKLFSGAAWVVFYLCLTLFLLSTKISELKEAAIFATLISGLFLIMVEGWGQRIFLVPLIGLIKVLQALIGTLSDVLSYSRLMALGLGTAVIALIVNQIAMLFGGMIPYVGWLVAGLILAGGHIFNLGINALSGFIHSGRLQFVEFFPKFLEGGGRRFEPIKPEFKYTKVDS